MSLSEIQVWSFGALVAAAVVFIVLERVRPYNKGFPLFREGLFDDFVLYNAVQSVVLGVLISSFIVWIDSRTGFSRAQVVSNWPIWGQVIFFVLLHDAYIYFFHRLQHRSPVLWRLHEAHHSPTQIDWIAGQRSHPLEILINQTIEFAPVIFLGASPEVAVIKGAISGIWGMYIHTNIDVRSGWLQYIFNGPEMHRWHHALDAAAEGKNFATKFAFWDWIFGTAYRPAHKASQFGLGDWSKDYPAHGYVKQVVAAFRPFDKPSDPEPAKAEAHA